MTSITKKFKQMYSSEIVPLLKQINELYAKRSELSAKIDELNAKINELYAKRSELSAKIDELDAKILWKFVSFEKENDCQIEWMNYEFELKDITIKSNAEIEAEKISKVPKEITHDGHKYRLIEGEE